MVYCRFVCSYIQTICALITNPDNTPYHSLGYAEVDPPVNPPTQRRLTPLPSRQCIHRSLRHQRSRQHRRQLLQATHKRRGQFLIGSELRIGKQKEMTNRYILAVFEYAAGDFESSISRLRRFSTAGFASAVSSSDGRPVTSAECGLRVIRRNVSAIVSCSLFRALSYS